MIDRAVYFWEKIALVGLVLLFMIFEIKLIIVISETMMIVFFSLINLLLLIQFAKNLKRFMELK